MVQFSTAPSRSDLFWRIDDDSERQFVAIQNIIRTNPKAYSHEELIALLEQAPTVLRDELNQLYDVAVDRSTTPKSLIKTIDEERCLSRLTNYRLIEHLEPRDRNAFREMLRLYRGSLRHSLYFATVVLDINYPEASRSWLKRCVTDETDRHWLVNETVSVVAYFLARREEPLFFEALKRRASQLADKLPSEESIMFGRPPGQYAEQRLLQTLNDLIEVERFCQSLDPESRDAFREFYVRLSQSLACAYFDFRDGDWGRANLAAKTIVSKESDRTWYPIFLTDLQGSMSASRCVVSLYLMQQQPIDLEVIRATANGTTEKSELAKQILDR